MIIQWSHHSVAHGDRGMTLNHLRQRGIWIVNANSVVRHLIHKCVICRKLREKRGYQKMADLPQERCTEAAPFTYCGVDMFGRLIIKERRSELKRDGALLIPSSWNFVDLWLEEEQSIQSGRTMEQILWVPEMNYNEHSRR